jgi:hypothetical protein
MVVKVVCIQSIEEIVPFISSFDADLSGENGEEYTSDEAKAAGFNSTIEYLVDEAKKTHDKLLAQLEHVLDEVESTYYDYYAYGYTIEEHENNSFLVGFAYKS